jgi:hypothetical protein
MLEMMSIWTLFEQLLVRKKKQMTFCFKILSHTSISSLVVCGYAVINMNLCLFCINTVRSESWGRKSGCRSRITAAWSSSAIHRSRSISTADIQWSGGSGKWRLACYYWHRILKSKFWEVLGRTNHLLSLTLHLLHRKWFAQQFCCCVHIRYNGHGFTELLSSNSSGIHIQTLRLMGEIYEICQWGGLHMPWYVYQVS